MSVIVFGTGTARPSYNERVKTSRRTQRSGGKYIPTMARHNSCQKLRLFFGFHGFSGSLLHDLPVFHIFHRQTIDLRLNLPSQRGLFYKKNSVNDYTCVNVSDDLLGIALRKLDCHLLPLSPWCNPCLERSRNAGRPEIRPEEKPPLL